MLPHEKPHGLHHLPRHTSNPWDVAVGILFLLTLKAICDCFLPANGKGCLNLVLFGSDEADFFQGMKPRETALHVVGDEMALLGVEQIGRLAHPVNLNAVYFIETLLILFGHVFDQAGEVVTEDRAEVEGDLVQLWVDAEWLRVGIQVGAHPQRQEQGFLGEEVIVFQSLLAALFVDPKRDRKGQPKTIFANLFSVILWALVLNTQVDLSVPWKGQTPYLQAYLGGQVGEAGECGERSTKEFQEEALVRFREIDRETRESFGWDIASWKFRKGGRTRLGLNFGIRRRLKGLLLAYISRSGN